MATELGKAYVQIIPSAKGISGSIQSELGGVGTQAGKTAGNNIVGALKGVLVAAGIGKILKDTLEAGGALQQSYGGLETLYGDAADAAKKYATEAAKAGISANNYAEQAVSFGASLKQAFGGDTTKAVEAANTAIMDMADNSAKMGTDISAIQNAYQGFAKQNYTMLDNLKLGYGGTKTEMERLLKDAQKLSGVEYNIDNLGDVYEAIHVIQTDLGLTGVAAEEASTTFTGSFNAMKSAAENLMANLALGEDIGPSLDALMVSVEGFLVNNLFPMIGNVLQQLPTLLSSIGDMIVSAITMVTEEGGGIADFGVNLVSSLVNSILTTAPKLAEAGLQLVQKLGDGLLNGNLMQTGSDSIKQVLDGITAKLPEFLNNGITIVSNIITGIAQKLPDWIRTATDLLKTFLEFIIANAPTLLKGGMELLMNVVQGILLNLPEIISATVELISTLLSTLVEHLPEILQMGIELVGELIVGLLQCLPEIGSATLQLAQGIWDAFMSIDWLQLGKDLIQGVINGITSMAGNIANAAKDAASKAFNAACDFLGISSPAKKGIYIGEMLDAGFAEGIAKNSDLVGNAVSDLSNTAVTDLTFATKGANFDVNTASNSKIDVLISLLSAYLPEIAENKGVSMDDMYNGLNRQLGWAVQ